MVRRIVVSARTASRRAETISPKRTVSAWPA